MENLKYYITDPDKTLIIKRAINGYTITTFADEEQGRFPLEQVFENTNEEGLEEDWKNVENLLWEILEHIGIHNSRHCKSGIEIKVTEGEES